MTLDQTPTGLSRGWCWIPQLGAPAAISSPPHKVVGVGDLKLVCGSSVPIFFTHGVSPRGSSASPRRSCRGYFFAVTKLDFCHLRWRIFQIETAEAKEAARANHRANVIVRINWRCLRRR